MSKGQTVNISGNATACFTCQLPSGSIGDEWTVDEHEIQETGPFNGSLIVKNPTSLLKSSSSIILGCGNKASGENFTVNVYIKGGVILICLTASQNNEHTILMLKSTSD